MSIKQILATSNLNEFTGSFLDRGKCLHAIKIVPCYPVLTSVLHFYKPCVIYQLKCVRSSII